MEQVTIQEALDFCLANPEGLSSEQLLARFPEYRVELASLLGLATGIMSLAVPSVPTDRREAMKSRLVAAAAAQPPLPREVAAVPVAPVMLVMPVVPVPAEQPSSEQLRQGTRGALPWFLRPGWVVAAAAILLIAFTWWSSAGALPDSPFYGIKLASESIALNLASSDEDRAQENIKLANNRLYDLRTMEQRDKLAAAQPAFDNYASHLDTSVTMWEKLKGTSHTDIARLLYASSAAGEVTFDSFGAQTRTLPASLRQEISDTEAVLSSVSSETAGSLADANIDPASVFSSVDSSIAPLLTPVTSVPVAVLTGTVTVPVGAVSPTVVAIGPTSAPRPPAQPATATAVASQPGPKATATIIRTIAATSTPTFATVPATDTPVVVSTNTPPAQLTSTTTPIEPGPTEIPAAGTATSTTVPLPGLPTDTPVPPVGSTPTTPIEPILPTDTPEPPVNPTSTPVPSSPTPPPPAPTSTNVPPSATPVPQANVCDLQIAARISASCASASSVSWSATVTNPGPGVVRASYKAEILIKTSGGGGFSSVKSISGTRDFSPGDTAVSGTIGYTFPANTQQWKIRFSIDTSGYSCTVASHQSAPMAPCQ